MPPVRVLHFGLGPIGSAVARQIAARRGVAIVGAVDIDPAKLGRDIGEVIGLPRPLGVRVDGEAARALRRTKPDIVVHCTGSSIQGVLPQLETILKAKIPVVSTTEELSYPGRTHRRQAAQIDAWARAAKAAVLGTGVNPGFAMDALAIVLTAACERVDRIRVDRVQDARIRRLPFQQKIGAGLTRGQFQRQVAAGRVRHVGLAESIAMIADAMGWRLDGITDDIRPKVATAAVASDFLAVKAGSVCGIVQDGVGYRGDDAVIRLHMEAYLGAPDTYDAIVIEGSPGLSMKMAGGIHGDIATASMVVNAIPAVLAAAPGLHTMRDIRLPSYWGQAPLRRAVR